MLPVSVNRMCKHIPVTEVLEPELLLPHMGMMPIPAMFSMGAVEEHVRLSIENGIPQDNRWGVLVVELYAGCGLHGRTVAKALRQVLSLHEGEGSRLSRRDTREQPKRRPPVVLLTIDNRQAIAGDTTLVVDARGFTPTNLKLLTEKMPFMAVVLLASPPCTEYSKVNTKPGPRDLEGADVLVRVVRDFHVHLGAVCTVMENPAAPSLLPGREVTNFLDRTCEVNYCAHGGMFFKKTQLWSGPAPFTLTGSGFVARLCAGPDVCPILLWDAHELKWVHPQWVGTSLAERQSIPLALSRSIGGALGVYLNSLGKL
jgi:hypothetical protein